jgi:gluconate 2-dehydrogenase gamma chain
MASIHPLQRRQFLKTAGTLLAGSCCLSGCGAPPSRWRFFTEAEADLADCIAEQIIPADQDPGARDAGVVNFLDKQLVGPYQRFQAQYHAGLAAVEQTSREMYGQVFSRLAWDQQTRLLLALEAGSPKGSAWTSISSHDFFDLIREHCMQGFYGSPRHGGNRNYVSYRMLGLDYPPVIGQNRYRRPI